MSRSDPPMPGWHRSPTTGERLYDRGSIQFPSLYGERYFSSFLTNVSSLFFRIRSEYRVTIGRFLSLDVPGLARYSGWVAWSHAGEFGLDVANPIPQEIVDDIVEMAAGLRLHDRAFWMRNCTCSQACCVAQQLCLSGILS